MAAPESLLSLPDVEIGGATGAHILWDSRPGFDAEWGMLCWNDQRYWFTMVCYDDENEQIWYAVWALTAEQARILDDWEVLSRTLSHQWRILANDPSTARSLAAKEKARQVEAISRVRPQFAESPIVGRFALSDYGDVKPGKKKEL